MKSRRTIIALRFSALGDVAICLSAIKRVILDNPDVSIILITKFDLKRLVECESGMIVVPVDLKREYPGVIGMARLFLELRRDFPGAEIADLHGVIRTRILAFLFKCVGRRVRSIDKGRSEKRRLTRKNRKTIAQLPSMFERHLDVFRKLDCVVSPLPGIPAFHMRPSPVADQILSVQDKVGKWVGVAPFSSHFTKTYPLSNVEVIVKALNAMTGHQVILFGGGHDEIIQLEEMVMKNPGVISVAAISLNDQLAIIARLDLMLSMDSANMHLASLFGVPVVSIWGPTHPYGGFMGVGQSMDNAVQLTMSCRPCSVYGNKPCWRGDNACLVNLSPFLVLEKAFRVLNGTVLIS